jgi:sirohydrochlorin cobaltochelatase
MKRLRHYKLGTSIILCCFGSVVEQKRFLLLKEKVALLYPKCDVKIALSSRMVIKKLNKEGKNYQHLPAVLAQTDLEGYQRVLVVSCYLFPTDEHTQLTKMVDGFRHFSLANIETTPAILHQTHKANDLLFSIHQQFESGSDINLFVHHGSPYLDNTGHQAIHYCDNLLTQLSDKNLSCSLEGAWPFHIMQKSIEKRINALQLDRIPVLKVIPMLLVSGNHFVKDLIEIKQQLSDLCEVEIASTESGESFNLISTAGVLDIIFTQIEEGLIRLRVPQEEMYHG